jgi:hypothetical protein
MARACTVCSRPDAGTVNELLRSGRSARSVAVELGLSEDAVQRHAQKHLANPRNFPEPAGARRPPSIGAGDPLDELVDALRAQALAGNPALVHQYRLALAAKAAAANATTRQVDLASASEWIEVRTRLLMALEPFPAARLAVAAALEDA